MVEFLWVLLIIGLVVGGIMLLAMVLHEFAVPEGHAGLLYKHGKFEQTLGPGRHQLTGRGYKVTMVDLRRQWTVVSGQELLTSDHISVKVSLVIQYQVADAVRAHHGTSVYQNDLHIVSQLVIRNSVSTRDMEALLIARNELGEELLAAIAPKAAELGLKVIEADVRDIMLPAEIRRANTDAVKVRKEGLATLERARGETAALRNLANAARMVENNPGLLNLRILQTVAASSGGHTMVLNIQDSAVSPPPKSKPAPVPIPPKSAKSTTKKKTSRAKTKDAFADE